MELFARDLRIRVTSSKENLLQADCFMEDALHDIETSFLVTVKEYQIIEARAKVKRAPADGCHHLPELVQELQGLTITHGFTRQVLSRVGGPRGCPNVANMILASVPLAINASWFYYQYTQQLSPEEMEIQAETAMQGICMAYLS